MPYPKGETITFDLGAIGAPEYTVTARDPATLAWGERRRVEQAQLIIMRLTRGNLAPDASDDWALSAMDEIIRKVVVSWTLPYPEGHPNAGNLIPLHSPEEEPDPLGVIPTDAYSVITEEVGKRLTAPSKRAK